MSEETGPGGGVEENMVGDASERPQAPAGGRVLESQSRHAVTLVTNSTLCWSSGMLAVLSHLAS